MLPSLPPLHEDKLASIRRRVWHSVQSSDVTELRAALRAAHVALKHLTLKLELASTPAQTGAAI